MLVDYRLLPDKLHDDAAHRIAILKSDPSLNPNFRYKVIRRNIDARQSPVVYILRAEIINKNINNTEDNNFKFQYQSVDDAIPIHIIGAGPAGYFAALECIRLGLKPIVIDRGKDVQLRRRDLRAIQQNGIVDPHSNYCFGEGGAGTYSDGKLYTRSNKRGNINDVLELLVAHGASEEILIDVHPHIGSNKLPLIIERMRQSILSHGGEIHFNTHIKNFIFHENKIVELIAELKVFPCTQVILATGHSARDIYQLLYEKKIKIESKPFALGVRIEHPQDIIDQMQYKQSPREENLPAASYNINCQIENRGVFSFCMCPGGLIIPAATAPGEIVVNGMSLSRRDSPYANSGLVTEVDDQDFMAFKEHGELRAMTYQASVEKKIFTAGDGSQKAPSQRMFDFINKKMSSTLPSSSYIPGLISAPIHELLPIPIVSRLTDGLSYFNKRMKLYASQEAVIVATESRTSAPVRIPRDYQQCNHPEIKNLYPTGEGAGYAGGILSAAMDGQRVAKAIKLYME